MRFLSQLFSATIVCVALSTSSHAVELLVSGDFETPQGVGDLPGWTLAEFFTGSDVVANSAEVTTGVDQQLLLRSFISGPISPEEGNFDQVKPDDVDGADFLHWQRGDSPTPGSATDLSTWQTAYSRTALFSNAVLSQKVPVSVGESYTFSGFSSFEDNYSGWFENLDAESPFGAIPSPTSTRLKLEFLDSFGSVIGSAATFDVQQDQITNGFPGAPLQHTLDAQVAPAGAVEARVTAEARDMAWNGNAITMGMQQAARFNDLSLTAASDPGAELLTNPGLDDDPPNALDFWNVETDPDPCCNGQILRTPIEPWANNTPGGTRGVWLSAFYGANTRVDGAAATPIDGIISQTVDIVPGGTYNFSGSSRFEGNYSGGVDTIAPDDGTGEVLFAGQPSPTKTEIVLEFLDSNENVLLTEFIDVKEDREAIIGCSSNGCSNDNQWYTHTFENVIAPALAVKARITGRMIDGVYNTEPQQSAFFDDFSLDGPTPSQLATSVVPEPSSVLSLLLGLTIFGAKRFRRVPAPSTWMN